VLQRRRYLEGGAGDVLPTLPSREAPPSERGAFLLLRRGLPWDGRIYRF
jgi:hypothetical protein